jgi:uncharacterized protein (DUF1499 family)
MKFLLRLIVLVLLIAVAGLAVGAYYTLTPPPDLYLNKGEFGGCPKRPSCVSSMAKDDLHKVAALGYTGDMGINYVIMHEVVERLGGEIQQEQSGYIHAVFVVKRFGFPLRDDLEVLMLASGRVDVRSASRFAYNDKGSNRARVEQLRRAFEAMP